MKLQDEFAKFSNYLDYIVLFWHFVRKVVFHLLQIHLKI